eukprot:7411808-Karenia_brevis.AAC.1
MRIIDSQSQRGARRRRESDPSKNPSEKKDPKSREDKRKISQREGIAEVKEEPASSSTHRVVENVSVAKRLSRRDVEVRAPLEDIETVKEMAKRRASPSSSES